MFVCVRDLVDAVALVVPIHFIPPATITVNIIACYIEQALLRPGINPFCPILDSRILSDIEFLLIWSRDEDVIDHDICRIESHSEFRKIVYVRHQHIAEYLRRHHFEPLHGVADRGAPSNLVRTFRCNRFFGDVMKSEPISVVVLHTYLAYNLSFARTFVVDRIDSGCKNLDENPDDYDQNNHEPRPYREQGYYPVIPLDFF